MAKGHYRCKYVRDRMDFITSFYLAQSSSSGEEGSLQLEPDPKDVKGSKTQTYNLMKILSWNVRSLGAALEEKTWTVLPRTQ